MEILTLIALGGLTASAYAATRRARLARERITRRLRLYVGGAAA